MLANALLKNKTLEIVDLCREDGIGDGGAQALVKSLNYNTAIRTLRLCPAYKVAVSQCDFPKDRVNFTLSF